MKKTTIDEMTFEKMLKSVSKNARKNSRQILEFIKIEIRKDRITAYSCDGYCASRFSFKNQTDEEFDAYIKPFKFSANKPSTGVVEIRADENKTEVVFTTIFNKACYTFEYAKWEIDLERIFETSRQKSDRVVIVDAEYLKKCIEGAKTSKFIEIHFCADAHQAFILKSEKINGDDDENEQLIMPCRRNGGE